MKGFDEVFDRSPASTQQILHATDYFDMKAPKPPELPKLATEFGAAARDYRDLIGGSVGEFDHEILLRQYTDRPTAQAAATHWRGGEFRVYEHKKESAPLLLYASEWDSPEAAQNFFALYERVLQGKWKTDASGFALAAKSKEPGIAADLWYESPAPASNPWKV